MFSSIFFGAGDDEGVGYPLKDLVVGEVVVEPG